MNTLSLYIHFPFCVRKCQYCDFLSGPGTAKAMSSYINDLKNEIAFRGQFFRDHQVMSVFFGGGTPSLLSEIQMNDIMSCIRSNFSLNPHAEITCECNPGTLSEDKLNGFLNAGINRLSIGLQSANDTELEMLGRIHRYAQFEHNYQLARQCGFKNINIDLMSALPGQSVASYEDTLDKVLALEPEHISAYSLIIEDGTPFADALPVPLPSEDDERLMYHLTKTKLAAHGYARYEISNYARPGFECRHNIVYWTRKNYLGLGLGSSSLIDEQRFCNPSDMKKYHELWNVDISAHQVYSQQSYIKQTSKQKKVSEQKKASNLQQSDQNLPDCDALLDKGNTKIYKTSTNNLSQAPDTADSIYTKNTVCEESCNTFLHGTEQLETLDTQAQMEEFMFLGLRLTKGISTKAFEDYFHTPIKAVYQTVIDKHLKDGTLILDGNRLYLSECGMDVANYVMSDFII